MLGHSLYAVGLRHVSASVATLLSLFEPVVAAVLAVLVVGEHLGAVGWAGIGLSGRRTLGLLAMPVVGDRAALPTGDLVAHLAAEDLAVIDRGRSSTTTMRRGTLYAASWSRDHAPQGLGVEGRRVLRHDGRDDLSLPGLR